MLAMPFPEARRRTKTNLGAEDMTLNFQVNRVIQRRLVVRITNNEKSATT